MPWESSVEHMGFEISIPIPISTAALILRKSRAQQPKKSQGQKHKTAAPPRTASPNPGSEGSCYSATLPSGRPVSYLTLAGCSCGGLQPAPPCPPHLSPPPQKAASINHNWLGTWPQTPTSRPKKHPNFVLPKHTPPPRPHENNSCYYYHHSPQLNQSCCVDTLALPPARSLVNQLAHRPGAGPRIGCPSERADNNPPSSSSQREVHHASGQGPFLLRVLVEPDFSATTTWAFLELASWSENG